MNRVVRDVKKTVGTDEMAWSLAGMTRDDWRDVAGEKGEKVRVPQQTFPSQIREIVRKRGQK